MRVGQVFDGTGWGGRVLDAVDPAGKNSNSLSALSTDYSSFFVTGKGASTRMVPGAMLNQSALAFLGANDPRVLAQQQLTNQSFATPGATRTNLFDAANSVMKQALYLNNIMTSAASGTTLFSKFPNTAIGQQLQQVANIIKMRTSLPGNISRQVFFCMQSGFDTHGGQDWGHMAVLAELDAAIAAFYSALGDMKLRNQVTTFTSAEFGRTLQPSGSGTDHGWGNHHFIIGDAVKGGDFYGAFPTLALYSDANSPDSALIGGRGVTIPTTSVSQVGATLATWFGVPGDQLPAMFPNLKNFTTQNLGFMSA